ncbi:hypothetical protein [Paenibacillus sp. 1-18]|nr:hypothetical protein [Paenibacillus sp. 1-18]
MNLKKSVVLTLCAEFINLSPGDIPEQMEQKRCINSLELSS